MERPAESTWLYNQPSEGIVKNWYKRNQSSFQTSWGLPWVIDGAVILHAAYPSWDGYLNTPCRPEDVILSKGGPNVPKEGSELWRIWQEYTNSEEARGDYNGSKSHLHSYSIRDEKLYLRTSAYDWHRMRVLGLGLRDGKIPENYRDNILPTEYNGNYVFESEHPNNTNSHSSIVTVDHHLVLATRGQRVDYYAGTVSASIEEQTNDGEDNSPFDAFKRAVTTSGKLKIGGEELELNLQPESLRLAGVILEPDVNCVGYLVIGRCEEEAAQVNETKIGRDRFEFDATNPVWTLPLDQPDKLIEYFFNPTDFSWHGTSRARIVAALSYVHGYEEALYRLYRAYLTS